MVLGVVAAFALLTWLAVLALPWQPHRTRERLEREDGALTDPDCVSARRFAPSSRSVSSASSVVNLLDLSDVCVLIPARDEAALIGRTLAALREQGSGLEVIVVDDQSTDGTAAACEGAAAQARGAPIALRVVQGAPLAPGWAGKLWALQQGFALVHRPLVLLLDADIELAPGVVAALRRRAADRRAVLASVMAELHCAAFSEKLLTPAFVLFFKLLYPFALANDPRSRVAAAAGGCMLVRADALRALGGFAAIRGALIDDCALAAALKHAGGAIWLGMSHAVKSLRVYGFADFWGMVSRSAFTQLGYSAALLLVTTLLMIGVLIAPAVGVTVAAIGAAVPHGALAAPAAGGWLATPAGASALAAALAWLAMSAAYWPAVRFYGLAPWWALTLPVSGALFLAMTWSSALRYWRGTRATWKNRNYESSGSRAERTE
jgi:hopene-associated glycosyltransferase HpnB